MINAVSESDTADSGALKGDAVCFLLPFCFVHNLLQDCNQIVDRI